MWTTLYRTYTDVTEDSEQLLDQTERGEVVDEEQELDPSHPPSQQQHHSGVGNALIHFGESVAEAVSETGEHVVEAVAEVVHEVQDVAVEVVGELQGILEEVVVMEEVAAEDEAFLLLEVNLMRTTSCLPEDIVQVATKHHHTAPPSLLLEEDDAQLLGHNAKTEEHRDIPASAPISAYLTLVVAVVGLSSMGPLLAMQDGVNGTIKIVWRKSATAVLLFPFVVRSIQMDGFPALTIAHTIHLLLAAGTYASMCVFFAWSLDYTTVGNAVILSNTQALLLLIGKVIMGGGADNDDVITMTEAGGALIAFGGAVFCSRDAVDVVTPGGLTHSEDKATTTLIGDAYALTSAVAGVAYLVSAKAVRPHMNLYVFMFCVVTIGISFSLLYAYMVHVRFTWDMDAECGVFGWLNWRRFDRLPVEVLMVLCCSVLGAMGYVRCMQYFSNVVISVAALSEPVVAELAAVLIGVGVMPGWRGWLGNALVLAGTFTVVYRPPPKGGGKHHY